MSILSHDDIELAKTNVYAHMLPTPQYNWPLLAKRTGADVWVKHENHTPIGAFKIRGGFNYMARLKAEQPNCPGIITATRGNHGQSVALAGSKVGIKTTILVPHGNNPEKNDAMRAFGAELIEHGNDFQEAYEYAVELGEERKLHPILPFHPWLMAGVSVYALEFLGAVPDMDTVYVPVGMGSGICGLIAARDFLGLKTKIVGVLSENAPSYLLSFESGKVVTTKTANTIADGVACRSPDEVALDILLKGAERMITVSDQLILEAMGHYFVDTHNVAEAAAAAPLAGLLSEQDRMLGKKVGLVMTGGNSDKNLLSEALKTI